MSPPGNLTRPAFEHLDDRVEVRVDDAEYRRLLGYPKGHVPGERAIELADWARRTFSERSRPWVYLREVGVQIHEREIVIDGVAFHSRQLHEHFAGAGVRRALVAAICAGRGGEEHARQLWQEGKPDDYFFLEVFGSAVVESLTAATNSRICTFAAADGLRALPHYSPGYSGWDVADQNTLFELIRRGQTTPFPEPIEVLASGMLRPKKSLLAVIGLTTRVSAGASGNARLIPCENCSFSPCAYRRAPYRHATLAPTATAPATYSTNPRALRKWAQERVRLVPRDDGTLLATFRFDGTTCSNMGRPLAFDYSVTLGRPEEGYTILELDCRPASDDDGHKFMCAYLSDAHALMNALASEKPLRGRPLNDVLTWSRASAPSGCHCDAERRAHKWGLAFEAIHFALAHPPSPSPTS